MSFLFSKHLRRSPPLMIDGYIFAGTKAQQKVQRFRGIQALLRGKWSKLSFLLSSKASRVMPIQWPATVLHPQKKKC